MHEFEKQALAAKTMTTGVGLGAVGVSGHFLETGRQKRRDKKNKRAEMYKATADELQKMAQVDAYQQKTEWSCSAGALKAVTLHHGFDFTEEELIKAIGARKGRGAETTDIMNGAKKLGFDAYEGSFESLDDAKKTLKKGIPIIADVQSFNYPGKGHYIVIAGFKPGKGFIVMDPNTKGKTAIDNWRLMSAEELEEKWWDRAMASPHQLMPKWGVMVKPKTKEKTARFITEAELRAFGDRYPERRQKILNKLNRDGWYSTDGQPLEKTANGDMMAYFQDNPQKLKEYQARQAAKKKGKRRVLPWGRNMTAKERLVASRSPRKTKEAGIGSKLEKLRILRKSSKGLTWAERKALYGKGTPLTFGAGLGRKGHGSSEIDYLPAVVGGGVGLAIGASSKAKTAEELAKGFAYELRVAAEKVANDPVKEKLILHGIPLALEWRKGEVRKYFNHNPLKKKSTGTIDYNKKMKADYGYVRGIIDADGEELDVYLGPNRESEKVFVLEKLRNTDNSFDENKIMLGYDSMAEAKKSYLQHQGKDEMGKVRELTLAQFKKEFMSKKKTASGDSNETLRMAAKTSSGDILGRNAMRRAKMESATAHPSFGKFAESAFWDELQKISSAGTALEALSIGGKAGGILGGIGAARGDDVTVGKVIKGIGTAALVGALIALGLQRNAIGKSTLPKF